MTPSGYSGTPLERKLGIKAGHKALFVNLPDHYFELFEDFPELHIVESSQPHSIDFIHLFCTHMEELELQFNRLKKLMKKDGIFRVCWPRGSSKIENELDGNAVRRHGLTNGLVHVKVWAVDTD